MAVWVNGEWLSLTSEHCRVVLQALEFCRKGAQTGDTMTVPARPDGPDWESVESIEHVAEKLRAVRVALKAQETEAD